MLALKRLTVTCQPTLGTEDTAVGKGHVRPALPSAAPGPGGQGMGGVLLLIKRLWSRMMTAEMGEGKVLRGAQGANTA